MHLKLLEKLKIPLGLMVLSVIFFLAEFWWVFFGQALNFFVRCQEPVNNANSAPCYLKFDVIFIESLLGVFCLSFLSVLIILIYSKWRRKSVK